MKLGFFFCPNQNPNQDKTVFKSELFFDKNFKHNAERYRYRNGE